MESESILVEKKVLVEDVPVIIGVVDIVVASYQGEHYIQQQLISIQQNTDYSTLVNKIYIVDDGSTDETELRVKALADKDDKLIWVAAEKSNNLGPAHNFQRGIGLTTAPLIMLCDQDDVWFKDKIVVSVQEMLPFIGHQRPVLAFSDLHVVDRNLALLCDSYFIHKKIAKTWHQQFCHLLQQNTVSGCSVIFNRALLNMALPIPEQVYMHDWWLALVAKSCGELRFIERPLLAYRQHASNTIGAKSSSLWHRMLQRNGFVHSVQSVILQAKAFQWFYMNCPSDSLSGEELEQLDLVANLESLTFVQRVAALCKGRITRSHRLAKGALMWVVLCKIPYVSK
ncbi:glycosyltransferase [Vibrio mimicus]|uniref:glycosyltransferase n=1 Tax=Vibrio mimicus TaxID=674 RepID=UPI0001BACE08|nr:glycosyltransferase [Vibrio mimicus]EEY46437.1 alpha-L-Rha alpha-1,3-L-rhamnosyltransferase [Vibrio mimicus VM223]